MPDLLLILGLGLLYPLVHLANGWLFSFAEITPHVSLIYLPAFLRLLNVLVLGKFKGSLATVLGGLLLMGWYNNEPTYLGLLHIMASAGGPVVALILFEHWSRRPVSLVSLTDLTSVTVMYCIANAILHHLLWVTLAPHELKEPGQLAGMILGDLIGALIGAYLLKWTVARLRLGQP